jgi:hypothetical protein
MHMTLPLSLQGCNAILEQPSMHSCVGTAPQVACREAAASASAKMLTDQERQLAGFILTWLPGMARQLRAVLVYTVNQDPDESLDLFGQCAPSPPARTLHD